MFRHSAWAVGSYSSGPPAARAVGTKSTGGFHQRDGSPCTMLLSLLEAASQLFVLRNFTGDSSSSRQASSVFGLGGKVCTVNMIISTAARLPNFWGTDRPSDLPLVRLESPWAFSELALTNSGAIEKGSRRYIAWKQHCIGFSSLSSLEMQITGATPYSSGHKIS